MWQILKYSQFVFAVSLLFVLSACETVPVGMKSRINARVADAHTVVNPSGLLSITDDRDPADKTSRNYSLWLTSCDFGVHRYGDNDLLPDRVARLDRDLASAFGRQLSGETIHVVRYDIVSNSAAVYYVMSMAAGSAAAGGYGFYSMPQAPVCVREKMSAGWFDPADLVRPAAGKAPASPMVVDIEVRIGATTFKINAAASSLAGEPYGNLILGGMLFSKLTSPGIDAALDATAKAHSRLIEQIRAADVAIGR